MSLLVFILFSNVALLCDVLGVFDSVVPIVLVSTPVFLTFVIFPSIRRFPQTKTKKIQRGVVLLVDFLITCVADVIALSAYWIVYCSILGERDYWNDAVIADIIIAIIAGNFIFWNGIIRVYIYRQSSSG